jgi:hypothetical protein
MTTALKSTNLAVKFALEMGALAAFAWWGATVAGGALAVLLAVGIPVIAAVLWGIFAAPRASRRLLLVPRMAFELTVFGLAAAALGAAASTAVGVAFAVVAIINAALLTVLDQWEQ